MLNHFGKISSDDNPHIWSNEQRMNTHHKLSSVLWTVNVMQRCTTGVWFTGETRSCWFQWKWVKSIWTEQNQDTPRRTDGTRMYFVFFRCPFSCRRREMGHKYFECVYINIENYKQMKMCSNELVIRSRRRLFELNQYSYFFFSIARTLVFVFTWDIDMESSGNMIYCTAVTISTRKKGLKTAEQIFRSITAWRTRLYSTIPFLCYCSFIFSPIRIVTQK